MCVSGICLIKIGRFQIVLAIAIGFLIYDVWWVFLSPSVFGESVMVEAATGMSTHVPAMFTFPKTLSVKNTLIDKGIYSPSYTLGEIQSNKISKIRLVNIPIYIDEFFSRIKNPSSLLLERSESLIGAGDIVIPGIVLDFFLRFDIMNHNLNIHSNLFLFALLGYVFGVALTWVMVQVMEKGQPALLWIFPSVLIPTTIQAARISVMKILWTRGAPISNSAENSSNSGNHHEQNDENQELQDIQDLQNENSDKDSLNINESADDVKKDNDNKYDENTELTTGSNTTVNRLDIMKEVHRKNEPQDVKIEMNEEEDSNQNKI